MEIRARVEKRLQATREYLDWLPGGYQARPAPHAEEHTGGADEAWWRAPLDDLHTRLAQLMEEVKYLHGAPTTGAPWILLRRNSDVLNAGQPTNYDSLYIIDMMRTYRHAADTATSIEDAAGIAVPHPIRGCEIMESCRKAGGRPMELPGTPSRPEAPHRNHDAEVRKPDGEAARRGTPEEQEEGAAAECRMANMLVEDVFAYELPEPVRQLIVAYAPPTSQHHHGRRSRLELDTQAAGNPELAR
jgi:hypothetical protein